jgi:Protein of unknown function (DUF2752)
VRLATASTTIDTSDARGAAVAMLAAAATLPLLPGHAGLPCPLRTLTGVPCPLCGMTTSVEATVHGHVVSALQANPAGPFAVLAALALLVRRPERPLRIPTVAVAALLLGLWIFELHRFSLI